MRFELRSFGDGNRPPAKDLARLHSELLGSSPVAAFGPGFVERFYYGGLPNSGLIFGAVAYLNDTPIGFAAGTLDSSGFLRTGLRRHWARLALSLPPLALGRPAAARSLWQTLRSGQANSESGAGGAQLLAIGVLPDFRTRGFKESLGLSPAAELLRSVTNRFSAGGAFRAMLYVDRDNHLAHRFYAMHGWRPERIVTAAGYLAPQMEFSWDAAPARNRQARERASLDKLIGITLADVGLGQAHAIEGFTEHSHDGLRGFVLKYPVG